MDQFCFASMWPSWYWGWWDYRWRRLLNSSDKMGCRLAWTGKWIPRNTKKLKKPSVQAAHSITTSWLLALGSHTCFRLRKMSGVMGSRVFSGVPWHACWRLRPLRTHSNLDKSAFLKESWKPAVIWACLTAERYDFADWCFTPYDPKNATNWQSIWVDTGKGVTLANWQNDK